MVRKADEEGKDITHELKLFGNTCKTHVEIVQKNIVKNVNKQKVNQMLKKSHSRFLMHEAIAAKAGLKDQITP